MKTMTKLALGTMAVLVGAGGFAASGNAQDWGRGRHETDRVVVVHKTMPQPVRGGLFDRLDINRSGSVAKWEFVQRYGDGRMAMKTFRRLDSNRNGTLSRQEVAAGREVLRKLNMRG